MLRSTIFLALAVGSSRAAPSVGPHSSLQPTSKTADASEAEVDLGHQYAATEPLVGLSIPFRFGELVQEQLNRSDCASLAASVDRHTYWFKEAPGGQQMQQRAFLENVTSQLCANPDQEEDEFTTIFHQMLQTARDAIAIHTHSAFWVKSTCVRLSRCYSASALFDTYDQTYGASEDVCDEEREEENPSCLGTVMAHEKYNLVEGYYFLNMTYHILNQGAAFCLDPNLESVLAEMSAGLEEVMAYHASNSAFEELVNSHFEQLCTIEDVDPDLYNATYDAMIKVVDEQILNPTECVFTDHTFEMSPFIYNNPPNSDDLITIIQGNTLMTIAAAAEAVEVVVAEGSCVKSDGTADPVASAALRAKLNSSSLPMRIYQNKESKASANYHFLSIPTVYHKAALMCLPGYRISAPNIANSMVCRNESGVTDQTCVGTSSKDANPIFDLVTSTDIAKCSGAACKAAGQAVLKYQTMLGTITNMRLDTVYVAWGHSGDAPLMDQDTWTYQRSCSAIESMIDKAVELSDQLPSVIADLRTYAPQLDAACIAPPRNGDLFPELEYCLDDGEPEGELVDVSAIARKMAHAQPRPLNPAQPGSTPLRDVPVAL